MALVFPPGQQFFDSNGKPVASGSLTFFDSGTTNLKPVYTDSAMTIVSANPVSLDASGRLPINLFGMGSYTIVLKLAAGAVVWSRDASNVGFDLPMFIQDGAGAVERDIVEKQKEIVSVKDFGAVGDGVADDTAAFIAALATGRAILVDGVYRIESPVNISGGARIHGIGATIVCAGSGSFAFSNAASATHALTANATGQTLEIADASGIDAGDVLTVKSETLFPYDNRGELVYGEQTRVLSKSGDVLTVAPLHFHAQYTTASNSSIKVYKPVELHLRGLNIIREPAGTATAGLVITGMTNPVVRDCRIEGFGRVGVSFNECYQPKFIGGGSSRNTGLSDSTQYGLQFNGCTGGVAAHADFSMNRRGVDFSGAYPCTRGGVYNCSAVSDNTVDSSGFGTHGGAAFVDFIGNNVHGARFGFLIRGLCCEVIDNHGTNIAQDLVRMTDGLSLNMRGNTMKGGQALLYMAPNAIAAHLGAVETYAPTFVDGNRGEDLIRAGLIIDDDAAAPEIYNVVFTNNSLNLRNADGRAPAAVLTKNTSASQTMQIHKGSIFWGNSISCSGTYGGYYGPGIIVKRESVFEFANTTDMAAFTANVASGSGTITGFSVHLAELSQGVRTLKGRMVFSFTVNTNNASLRVDHELFQRPDPFTQGRDDPFMTQGALLTTGAVCPTRIRLDGQMFVGAAGGDSHSAEWTPGTYTVCVNLESIKPVGGDFRWARGAY